MKKIIAVVLCLGLVSPLHAGDKFWGWVCLLAGGFAVYDGAQQVEIKTGTETKQWLVMTYEDHYVYLVNRTTLVTAWYTDYPYTAQDGNYVDSYSLTDKYYDSFSYWHIDNYMVDLYEKTYAKTTKKNKSDGEIVAGGALIGVGIYLLAKKPIDKMAESLKGNGITLAYNQSVTNPQVTASVKF